MAKKRDRGNGDGDVWPRKNKEGKVTSYQGSFIGPDGKRHYVSGKNKEEARTKLRRARSDVDRGVFFADPKLRVADYLDQWLNDSVRGNVEPVTHESYARLVRVHISPALGNVKLAKLTPAHLQGFYRDKLDAGLSPRTVQYLHVVLHRALKQARRWRHVNENVAEAVDPPRVPKKEVRTLSIQEAKRLLDSASKMGDRFEALYVLAIHTGMRQGELLGLRWSGVDLEHHTLHVRGTKTASSRRTVGLSQVAVQSLRRHLNRQLLEIEHTGDAYQDDGLVFASEVGTSVLRQNLVRRSFKPLLRKAGLPDIPFHNLRHTFATILFERGKHPKSVQMMMGHASVKITLDTYSHVVPGMDDGIADEMDDALS